ncbi:hypothetical protein ACFL6C_13460, partial [Myxococcota bacterium]
TLAPGEICCAGVVETGDCCGDEDCAALETCQSHSCTPSSPMCGDTICNAGEDCTSCPADCTLAPGEICCAGVISSGDCCDDRDCASPAAICDDHVCTTPDCVDCEDCGTCAPDDTSDDTSDDTPGGCSCDSGPSSVCGLVALVLVWFRRRRLSMPKAAPVVSCGSG